MNNITLPFGIYRIDGDSMSPSMRHDDYVITSKWLYKLKHGDIVVVQHSEMGVIIKRIAVISDSGIMLKGDNLTSSVSTDVMGLIQPSQVLAKVIYSVKASPSL